MKYNIKDADGNIVNTIVADTAFVEANFTHYELFVEPTPPVPTVEEKARMWRDMALGGCDWVVPLTDHPQHAAYMTYRADLRDWPATDDFPDTKPILGS